MPEFKITDDIITKISNTFCISKEKVAAFHRVYEDVISNSMKRHYLAHVIRAMEEYLRNMPGNEMFRIICSPVAEDSKNIGIARSHYHRKRFFAIYYHPKINEKQLRIMLAHELGHLFLVELANSSFSDAKYDEKTEIEPISTILGIFTILDKNDFCYNKTAPFKHNTPDEVIDDFKLLKNRDSRIYNIS